MTFLLSADSASSQSAENIKFDQILPKKVRSLLKKEQLETKADFKKMQASCYDELTQAGYWNHVSTLQLEEPVETVWETYQALSPKELGGGKIISFGLSYSRKHNKIIYPDDECGRIEEGQIIISGLRYLGGFVKLAVAQEITAIDETDRVITFCYMQNGKTLGSQHIRFQESSDGGTEIVHETFYRSKSKFRDKKLYPGLHEKTIIEMHKNVLRKIQAESRELAANQP